MKQNNKKKKNHKNLLIQMIKTTGEGFNKRKSETVIDKSQNQQSISKLMMLKKDGVTVAAVSIENDETKKNCLASAKETVV